MFKKLFQMLKPAKPEIPRDMVKMEAVMNYIKHQEWLQNNRQN